MLINARFHHLGLAVRNRKHAAAFLAGIGYRIGPEVFDPLQNVRLTFCENDNGPAIEIITPGEGTGAVDSILRHTEALAYHTCYAVADSAETARELQRAGMRVMTISAVKPAILFPGQAVSFHQIPGFGLIELVEPLLAHTRVSP
jgi:hypothetical protein